MKEKLDIVLFITGLFSKKIVIAKIVSITLYIYDTIDSTKFWRESIKIQL